MRRCLGAATLRPQRTGVTLVEVLVVLSMVAILFYIFTPALCCGSGETSRRTHCINNQRNIALAMQQFNSSEFRLPGWAEPMIPREKEPAATPTGWVFPILPYLERGDVYRKATLPGTATYNTNPRDWPATEGGNPHIKVLVCPSDVTAKNRGMNISYVANAGYRDGAAAALGPDGGGFPAYDGRLQDGPASAVFLNHYGNAASKRTPNQSLERIADGDGTSNTLMFSENLHAGGWDLHCDSNPGGPPREGLATFNFANSLDAGPNNQLRINAAVKADRAASEGQLPGPNSFHPNGVVAAFCDGHTVFISQDIDWKVWTLLFTPDGAGLRTTWPDGQGAANVFQGMTLTERF